MLSEKRASRRPGWLRALSQAGLFLALALAGAAIGYGAGTLADGAGVEMAMSPGEALWLLALLVPFGLLGILAHELGHLAGGRLAGFRFLLLIVGPFKLQRYGERVRFGLNRSLGFIGGLAASTPLDDRDLPRRMLLMVAGGPLASLMAGLLGLVGAWLAAGFPAAALFAFGVLNLCLALVSIVPMRSAGFYTDGARILMLLRGGPRAERWCAVGALTNAAANGRPRDLSPALLALAASPSDGTLDDVGARLLAYFAALDRGEAAAAGEHLDYVLGHREAYPPAGRPSLLLEGAFFLARHRGDPEGARALLDQARGGMFVELHTRRRVEAAVLLAEGRRDEAAAAADEGLRRLRALDRGPTAAFEADLLRDLAGRAGAGVQ